MRKLQISYVTWRRPDANGLFDYEDLKDKMPDGKIIVQNSGYISRSKDTYSLKLTESKTDNQNSQNILKFIKKEGYFFMQSLNIYNEPLFKIIGQQIHDIHQIKKKDSIRFGKVVIEVLQLQFKHKIRMSSYEKIKMELQNTKINQIRQITPQFYGLENIKSSNIHNQKTSFCQSQYQENPSCRYCYSKTITQDNPFLISCGCIGSSRYIHQKCQLQWAIKRGKLQETPKKGVLYAEQKIFKCQLCHQFFYVPQIWRKMYEHQKKTFENLQGDPYQQVLILHIMSQTNWLYFIDLSKSRDIFVGRGLDNDIVLNQLSVSRQHAKISIDSQEKIVILSNNNAKFGTLVSLHKTQIRDDQTYQVGRTKMSFKIHEKQSFLRKIAIFCFVQQKLKPQNLKKPQKIQLIENNPEKPQEKQ